MRPLEGVDYQYFLDENSFAKSMIKLDGPGYVWFDWLMNINDENKQEQLIAKYARVNAYFGNYERGIAVYNDSLEIFEKYAEVDAWLDEFHTCHHPFKATINGQEHYYLTGEFGFTRVKPVLSDIVNPAAYESFSCLQIGTAFDASDPKLDRDEKGGLIYGWKKNTDAIDHKRQLQLITGGHMRIDEAWVQLMDIDTGNPILLSRGSVFWNEYRQKWILIMGINDTWYAEADSPIGPWGYAKKIAAHDNAFYNPLQHPFFDQDSGKTIFFEGTYTQFFDKKGPEVPLYNYNQLMYSLALDHPDLHLPVAVYRTQADDSSYAYELNNAHISQENILEIPFFALERPQYSKSSIPIFQSIDNGKIRLSRQKNGTPLLKMIP